MRSALAALLVLAAAGGLAADAAARAPSAQERHSIDHLLQRLQADREEDQKGPRLDPMEALSLAYQKGETKLEDWLPVADIVKEAKNRGGLRDKATTALIDRVRAEEQKPGADGRALARVKNDVCKHLLRLVVAEDMVSRTCIFRITEAFMPRSGADWKPDDSLAKRSKAMGDLQKKLK